LHAGKFLTWRGGLLVSAVLLVVATALLSFWNLRQARASAQQVERGYRILNATQALLSTLTDAETGQRGFLLTGDPAYLEPYNLALSSVASQESELRSLIGTAPLATLPDLIDRKLSELAETIRIHDRDGAPAAVDVVKSGRGRATMEAIRVRIRELENDQHAELTRALQADRRRARNILIFTISSAIVLFLLLLSTVVAIERDALKLESANQNLRIQYRRLQEATHTLDMAQAMVRRPDGTIVLWTHGMELLYGFTPQEAVGTISHKLLHTEFPVPLDRINQVVLDQGQWRGELVHRKRGGELVHVVSTWTRHLDAEGQPTAVIEVNNDISERKKGEEEIRTLNADLERRVQQRTAQLEETNLELESFAYTISHDLRAPLRTMHGFSQALLEDYRERLDETAADYIQRIGAAAARMDLLIQDLLSYSRLSRKDLRLEPVNLSAALRDALEQLQGAIRESRAVIEIAAPLPVVLGQFQVLTQVLGNLVSNAIKFVPRGLPPRVQIRAERQGSGAIKTVRLTIEDNGIGIEPKHRAQIFQVFHRLHGVDSYPGTGIGLAIVRKGIERLGGVYGVESAPERGSRFWIELPEAKEHGQTIPHPVG